MRAIGILGDVDAQERLTARRRPAREPPSLGSAQEDASAAGLRVGALVQGASAREGARPGAAAAWHLKLTFVRGRLFPADGDWYEWRQEPPLGACVLVRVAAVADGRLVLTGLRVDGEPTAQVLRSIPVGRIEAAANAQLTVVDDAVVPVAVSYRRPPAAHEPRASDEGWDTISPALARARPAGTRLLVLDLMRPPDGTRRRHPEAFYQQVAAAYLALAQTSPRPAAELAEANGVPTSTAHRWIKEARHRGFLPPGRPGKAG
jgi:hypothetical protein